MELENQSLENTELEVAPESASETVIYNIYSASDNESLDFHNIAIDSFDRIVSEIPSYYGYAAYKVSDSEYTLVFSSEYSVADNNLYFGSDAKISNISIGEDHETITFYSSSAPNTSLYLSDGQLYYTNLVEGFPSLGDHELPFADFIGLGFVLVVLSCVFTRISRR